MEEWMTSAEKEAFRQELVDMSEERVAMEAAAVVAQLLERDTKLADEIASAWGEILSTETLSAKMRQPAFDRLEKLAKFLTIDEGDGINTSVTAKGLKQKMIDFFDKYFSASSPERRAVSARVYSQKAKKEYDSNIGKPGILSSYADSRHLKQFLSVYPTAPYWI